MGLIEDPEELGDHWLLLAVDGVDVLFKLDQIGPVDDMAAVVFEASLGVVVLGESNVWHDQSLESGVPVVARRGERETFTLVVPVVRLESPVKWSYSPRMKKPWPIGHG